MSNLKFGSVYMEGATMRTVGLGGTPLTTDRGWMFLVVGRTSVKMADYSDSEGKQESHECVMQRCHRPKRKTRPGRVVRMRIDGRWI